MTQEELAKKIGVTKGAVANYENETSHPKEPIMYALIDALEVDPNYLFQDSVHIATSFSNDATLIAQCFDELDEYGQHTVQAVLRAEQRRMSEQKKKHHETERLVSMVVYRYPAAAGTPLYAESDFDRIDVPSSDLPNGADFGIRISGDSMEPTIPDGAIVWVHKTSDVHIGQIGIFMLDGQAVCKRVNRNNGLLELSSDNPNCDPASVNEWTRIDVVGKVIGHYLEM